jgi:hypothetical protein
MTWYVPPFVGLFVFVEERLDRFRGFSFGDLVDIRDFEHRSARARRQIPHSAGSSLATYGATWVNHFGSMAVMLL